MAELRKLIYGTPTHRSGIAVRMGVEQGFFRDIGIDLDVRTIFGGPPLAAAYDSGEFVFGQIGSPPAVNAIAGGARFRIVGGGLRRKLHSYLAVRPDIETFEDLKGARIGILSLGSCADWFLRAMLRHRGLDPESDVEIVELKDGYPEVISMAADGRIDGGVIIEPILSEAETMGVMRNLRAMYDEDYLPEAQWIVRVARDDFARDEPGLLRELLKTCRRSAYFAAENTCAWREYVERVYGVDSESAARAAEREFPHYHLDGEISRPGIETIIELQKGLGAVGPDLSADDVLDLRFLQAA